MSASNSLAEFLPSIGISQNFSRHLFCEGCQGVDFGFDVFVWGLDPPKLQLCLHFMKPRTPRRIARARDVFSERELPRFFEIVLRRLFEPTAAAGVVSDLIHPAFAHEGQQLGFHLAGLFLPCHRYPPTIGTRIGTAQGHTSTDEGTAGQGAHGGNLRKSALSRMKQHQDI
jgi:hypothetical protein